MTGWAGTYHTNRMMQYGTRVVAGVTPGKGGKSHLDVPVFDRVAEAMRETRRQRQHRFRSARPCRERDDRGDRGRDAARGDGDRAHARARHGARARGAARVSHPPRRAQLARRAGAGHVPDRRDGDGSRAARQHRRRLALGLADERGGEAAHRPRSRPVDHRGHRRGSRARHRLRRLPGAVLRRSANRRRRADRRDRRRRGTGGRGLSACNRQ